MEYYRKFDTIGLISLNDWYVIDFPLKNYDENGNGNNRKTLQLLFFLETQEKYDILLMELLHVEWLI